MHIDVVEADEGQAPGLDGSTYSLICMLRKFIFGKKMLQDSRLHTCLSVYIIFSMLNSL